MKSSIININDLSEEELNEFILKFLSLLKKDLDSTLIKGDSDKKEELCEVLNQKLSEINNSHTRQKMLNDSFRKIQKKSYKNNIIEGFFELISFFENKEEYEHCAMLKKIKDNLLMDF